MLLKKPGDLRLHRLRIVQLIEADFNQFLRIAFARPLAVQGQDSHWFQPSQYARSERTCLTAVLLKVLTYECMRIMKVYRATMDNDATRRFNRIIPVLASIACQTLGATGTSCKVLSESWQDQQHHVRIG
jgi:hypothetical protein